MSRSVIRHKNPRGKLTHPSQGQELESAERFTDQTKNIISSKKCEKVLYVTVIYTTTIGIVEKISSAQHIAASFPKNHQIRMMKRGPTNHHTPSQDCSNCGQLGHPWFTCPHIVCDGCNENGHIYRHCWDRIPPSGTANPPKGWHNNER